MALAIALRLAGWPLLPLRRSGAGRELGRTEEHRWISGNSSAGSTRSTC